jgi:peptidoglycan hydrolase-like protein with peptidoglycan-binding domain
MAAFSDEIAAPATMPKQGDKGPVVKRLQEWLVVNDIDLGNAQGVPDGEASAAGIDSNYGTGTDAGCASFATANGLAAKTVDGRFWQKLTSGMQAAFTFATAKSVVGEAIIDTAQAHLAQKPREARRMVAGGRLLGLDNSGPWVRAYCFGISDEWCQGAASTWVRQAFAALGKAPPFSLDQPAVRPLFVPDIAEAAQKAGRLILGSGNGAVPPGSFFFVKAQPGAKDAYLHVGIVTSAIRADGTFSTIEGNAATDNTDHGWQVRANIRRRAGCDFGRLE